MLGFVIIMSNVENIIAHSNINVTEKEYDDDFFIRKVNTISENMKKSENAIK